MAWKDWVRTLEVEPSLYAADFLRLGEPASWRRTRRASEQS